MRVKFGNHELAEAMAKKFGSGKKVVVKPNYILKVQPFCQQIERAHKATAKSTLNFR